MSISMHHLPYFSNLFNKMFLEALSTAVSFCEHILSLFINVKLSRAARVSALLPSLLGLVL